jgi:RimJ/RimL family protein N-acetyltransferase
MGLEGKFVRLREERPEDMQPLVALRNDLATQAWSLTLPPDYTEQMYLRRFEGREFSFRRFDGQFVIESLETGEFVGRITYSSLRPRWSADIGIMVARAFWGTGFAHDAQETLLKFLFQELGLRVVRLYTHSGNPQAVGLAQKSGFQIAARRRQAVFKAGELFDNLTMDLLREEYFALHPELSDRLPPLV